MTTANKTTKTTRGRKPAKADASMAGLQGVLMDTIHDLRTSKIDVATATAITQIGHALIKSAQVEVEHQRFNKAVTSAFMQPGTQTTQGHQGAITTTPSPPGNGITSVVQHRMGG